MINRGCIVVGYQGIGKSTLANEDLHFIDLESSNFFHDDLRPADWYIYYCNIALSLARQGYIVFVSSHKEVRDYLTSVTLPSTVYLMCCVPALELKDFWIERLKSRFHITTESKDFKAWKNAEDRYEENILEIINSFYNVLVLQKSDYKLKDALQIFFINNRFEITI